MTINQIPDHWETQRLVVKDSILADIPELDQVSTACAYMEEWSGWKSEPGSSKSMLPMFTEGELPPDGSKEFFRMQSLRLNDTGQMIGLLVVYHGYPTANIFWILYLFIHPDFQSKGYGQEAAFGLSDKVKSLGYTAMRLVVDVKNWPAMRFWIKGGFDKIIEYRGDKVLSDDTYAHLIIEKTFAS